MNNHRDIILNYNDFNEEHIIFIKPVAFYKVTKNMGIYYNKEIIEKSDTDTGSDKKKNKKEKIPKPIFKRQKIIIQTPKMMVPFDVKEFVNKDRKSYQMTLSFAPLTNLYNENEVKKFFLFMRKIDSVIDETISDHLTEWKLPQKIKYTRSLKKLSSDFPHMFNMNLPYDEKEGFLFNVYDESATKSNIAIIKKRCVVSAILELTDLRFGDSEYRANWNVMQIRKFKPYSPIQEFFMSGCFIIDEDDPEDQAYAQIIETYQRKIRNMPNFSNMTTMQNIYANSMANMSNYQMQIPPPPGMPSISTVPPPPPPPPKLDAKSIYVPPSADELKNMLGKLKKTETVEKVAKMGNIIERKDIEVKLKTKSKEKITQISDISDDTDILDTPRKSKIKNPIAPPIKKKSNNASIPVNIEKKKIKTKKLSN